MEKPLTSNPHSGLHGPLVFTSVVIAIGYALNFAFNLEVSKLLSPHDYGDYKVANSFLSLGKIAVMVGGGSAALRFLPTWMNASGREGVWEYLRVYLQIILGFSLLIIILMVFAGYVHKSIAGEEDYHPILFTALVIPIVAASSLVTKTLQAAGRLDLAFIPSLVGTPLLCLCLLAVFQFSGQAVKDITIIIFLLVASILVLVFQFYQTSKHVPVRRATHLAQHRHWLQVSAPLMLVVTLSVLINQTDIFMLEIIGDDDEVGLFGACGTITGLLSVVTMAVLGVLSPRMRQAYEDGPKQIRLLNSRGCRQLLLTGIPVALLIAFFSSGILALFGSSFVSAKPALLILLSAYTFQTALLLPTIWLQYTGHENKVLVVLLGTALLNISLDLLTIPHWGLVGAAISTAISVLFSTLIFALMMYKYLGVFPWSLKGSRTA